MFFDHKKIHRGLVSGVFAWVLLGSHCAVAQTAEDVDTFLSRPLPPAATLTDAVRQVLAQGMALGQKAPERQAEIDAHLIPYRRLVPAPAAAPSSSATTPPKPLLILDNAGKIEAIRAQSVETQGDLLIVTAADGNKSVWQKAMIKEQLSWYTATELASGSVDLGRLTSQYTTASGHYPAVQSVFQEDLGRIQAAQAQLAAQGAQKKAALDAQMAAAIAPVYDLQKNYTRTDLARLLLAAEAVRALAAPEQQAQIDAWAVPFRTHFENLLSGMVLEQGVWLSRAQVEARELAKQDAARFEKFRNDQVWHVDATVLPDSRLIFVIGEIGVVVFLVVVLEIFGLLGDKALVTRIFSLVFLLTSAGAGYYGYQLLGKHAEIATQDSGCDNSMLRLLYLATEKNPTAVPNVERKFLISDNDINYFLQKYVRWDPATGDENQDAVRTGVKVHWVENGAQLWEQVHWRRRDFTIRYDLQIASSDDAGLIVLNAVHIGEVPVLGSLRVELWLSLSSQLNTILSKPPVFTWFGVTHINSGTAEVAATFPVSQEKPAPAAAPVSAAPAAVSGG